MKWRIASFAWIAATVLIPVSGGAQEGTVGPERGTLVIVGGGDLEIEGIYRRFVELAGGNDAKIAIVPTAASSRSMFDYENHKNVRLARDTLGLRNVAVVHTHDRKEADTERFVAPIREADGVWFTGGRQWRLADAYLGTLAEREFHNVLKRGGVIGGSSSGASIQASFLVRGDTQGNSILIGDHQHGFGFIRDSAIDQHVIPRSRQRDLITVLTDPDNKMNEAIDRRALLGMGIDESTAIIVRGNEFEVIGKPDGIVLVYDPSSWTPNLPDDEKYLGLGVGSRYDMKRRVIIDRKEPACYVGKRSDGTEGFYKDLFMSGGVNLSSRRRLPAAESLGLCYEYYASRDRSKQNEILCGSSDDVNGVLLFPDGQPRFRMVYVNGGSATLHGKSLESRGRRALRQFWRNGGSYCGSCAGSFLSGKNTDSKTSPRLGYLHIFPHNTLNTGLNKTRVGHFVPQDSPLLEYRDFGGDRYVADIYHNNGNWLSVTDGDHLSDTVILATYDSPAEKTHRGAAIWAYKTDDNSGRIVNIGSHPEGITNGKRLALTEACLLYALDGIGQPRIRGTLNSGVVRIMNKDTLDNDPAFAKIGDRQYHHFRFEVEADRPAVEIEVEGEPGFDFHLFLRKDSPALRSGASHADTSSGSTKTMKAELTPGTWFVGVECATPVEAKKHASFGYFVYSGQTSVLNGGNYQIRMTQRTK
jgi:cyanophycinase